MRPNWKPAVPPCHPLHVRKLLDGMKTIAMEITDIAHKEDDALLEEDLTHLATPTNKASHRRNYTTVRI